MTPQPHHRPDSPPVQAPELYRLPIRPAPRAPLASVLSSHPDGPPRSRATRRKFLTTLANLGLAAGVAPLVYHMLGAPMAAHADPPASDAAPGGGGYGGAPGAGGGSGADERVVTGQFFFPRLQFQCYANAPNKKWDVWPEGDQILRGNVKKNTNINILTDPVVVNLDRPDSLYQYPFVFMTSEGDWTLTEDSSNNLREYLHRGGFLYADDCTFNQVGDHFYHSWCKEVERIFPDDIVKDVPLDHEVFHCFYKLVNVPHCQGVRHPARGLFDKKSGRLMSLCTSGDIHCGWVGFGNLDQNECKKSLEFGTNIIIHCLSH